MKTAQIQNIEPFTNYIGETHEKPFQTEFDGKTYRTATDSRIIIFDTTGNPSLMPTSKLNLNKSLKHLIDPGWKKIEFPAITATPADCFRCNRTGHEPKPCGKCAYGIFTCPECNTDHDCPDCAGSGFREYTNHTCRACDGTKKSFSINHSIYLNQNKYSLYYLAKIQRLPKPKIYTSSREAALKFTYETGFGFLMNRR